MPFIRNVSTSALIVISAAFVAAGLLSSYSVKAQDFWERLPGSAIDVGDGWVIGTNEVSGGFGIYRWQEGSGFEPMPGGAVRIGGSRATPWVVNDASRIYRWNGTDWDPMPGNARDVGDGWVIGNIPTFGGFSIHRWDSSIRDWERMPGGAVRIGGTFATPWVVNDQKEIYRWNGVDWDLMPGSANDVGAGWVVGTSEIVSGNFGIYRWNSFIQDWDPMPGFATSISKATEPCEGYIHVANSSNETFRHLPNCEPDTPIIEDCVSFNNEAITLKKVENEDRWFIVDGDVNLYEFDDGLDAALALTHLRRYGANQSCFVGRPDPSMQYFLVDGSPPTGPVLNEDCGAFDLATLDVEIVNGTWTLVDGDRRFLITFPNENEARQGLAIVKRKHRFTHLCFVGRPDASFQYFRR